MLEDMAQMETDLEQSRAECRAMANQLQRAQRVHDATVNDRRTALGLVAEREKQSATLRKQVSDLNAQVRMLQDEADVAAEEVRSSIRGGLAQAQTSTSLALCSCKSIRSL